MNNDWDVKIVKDRKTGELRQHKRRRLVHLGQTRSIRWWSKQLGISINTIYTRLQSGCTDAEALRPPVHADSTACCRGHVYTLHEHDSALDSYYTDNRGQKVCKKCSSLRQANYRARKLEREAAKDIKYRAALAAAAPLDTRSPEIRSLADLLGFDEEEL